MDEVLTDKQRKLITDNYGLLSHFIIKSISNRVVPTRLEDEFISDMHLRFCISALKYDIETGYNWGVGQVRNILNLVVLEKSFYLVLTGNRLLKFKNTKLSK